MPFLKSLKDSKLYKIVPLDSEDVTLKRSVLLSTLFGLNRSGFIYKRRITRVLINIYTVAVLLTFTVLFSVSRIITTIYTNMFVAFMLCAALGWWTTDNLDNFTKEIANFDQIIKHKLRLNKWKEFWSVFLVVVIWLLTAINLMVYRYKYAPLLSILLTAGVAELYTYDHLISEITMRMQILNDHLRGGRKPLDGFSTDGNRKSDENISTLHLYRSLASAFDYAAQMMRWPLLLVMTSVFIQSQLRLQQFLSSASDRDVRRFLLQITWGTVYFWWALVMAALPLGAVCASAGRVRGQLHLMRGLLAYWLLEDTADIDTRRMLRATMRLSEVQDMSLKLLGAVTVDSSLPITYFNLLVSQLIVLLQLSQTMKKH